MTRTLPILDFIPPTAASAEARQPMAPGDERLAEYRPEARALPRFHVWTLGCQMNRSDSEEMAGRLLAAGCAEAPGLEAADLIVINTCAIREGAEQKVIGRQGHLARLKAANPGLRVVLTGCSVREPDRAGLAPALPGGGPLPASGRGARARRPARARLGPGARSARSAAPSRRLRPRWSGARSSARPIAWRPRRAAAVAGGQRRARVGDQRLAADHLRLRQDAAPTASSRSAAARSGAARSTRSSTRRARWPPPATARSRSSARTSTRYGHDLPPEPRFGARRHRALGRPPARPRRRARTSPS